MGTLVPIKNCPIRQGNLGRRTGVALAVLKVCGAPAANTEAVPAKFGVTYMKAIGASELEYRDCVGAAEPS